MELWEAIGIAGIATVVGIIFVEMRILHLSGNYVARRKSVST